MRCKHFIWIILSFTASCITGKKIKIGKMNITYGAFKPFVNKYLTGAKISTEPAETMSECVQKCEEHKNCTSANFKTKQCDLLSDNKHISKEKLENLTGSIHVAKMNKGCDQNKCHNNATCVPDYENNTFSCNCKPGYTGKFCELMPQSATPDWWFKFDGGTENDWFKPNDATLIPEYTDKDKAIFYGQPHRKGKYMECRSQCTKSTVSWPGWSDPQHHDISFALWIKFPPEHGVYQKTFTGIVHTFSTWGKGVSLYYWKTKQTWIFDVRLSNGYFESKIPLSLEDMKNWNFLAMSWRNGTLSGFVNDKTNVASDKVARVAAKAENKKLFHPAANTIFNIDEFRVWYQGKFPEDMKQLYNKEKTDMWH